MQVEIRLKQILNEYVPERRVSAQQIADDLRVHRHTIGKLYRNQMTNPSLKVLGQLCNWLQENGVPGDILPQALFGTRPAKLWQAVAEPGIVRFYLGMYQQTESPA